MELMVTDERTSTVVAVTVDATTAVIGNDVLHLRPTAKPHVYEATVDGRTVPVHVVYDGIETVQLSLNGYTHLCRVRRERDHALLGILQASPAAQSRVVRVGAPMPGLLKDVIVNDGAVVRKGDVLFVLEAMKMENAIKAPIAGTVHAVSAAVGTAIDKGAALCTIEPHH